jgi:DNA-directed RNA polymerase subunit M/transcription elongation factor TFIIS
MNFCPNCQNKLYPLEEEEKLYNSCVKCGFKDEYRNTMIHKKVYKGKTMQQSSMNQFSRYDVSLPRTNKKICPNTECISHQDKSLQEAVFIMDPVSLKLSYMCVACGTDWKYH